MSAFSIVRIYGTDCNQPSIALGLAKKYNKKVFLGVYDISPMAVPGQIRTIVSAAYQNGGWGNVDAVSIGNEDVQRGASPGQVIAAVNQARAMLRPAGYGGAIVHVDTQNAILAHPELCGHVAGDYIAANIHAFFNPNTPADHAGDFVAGQVDALRQCGSTSWKRRSVRVRVAETGWPKAGEANGMAVPGKSYQQAAIASIKSKLSSDVFLFSAFNNYWMKDSAGTFNAEHFWGTLDD
jgi:exo-beta-1,3-glucanase (GH17 family)